MASTASARSSMATASRMARIWGPPEQRTASACSTPSLEPNRLNTVARETSARSASSVTVAWVKPPDMISSSAASSTRSRVIDVSIPRRLVTG